MALKLDFYQEIFEREQTWISSLESDLLNPYYLPEIKRFYSQKLEIINYELKSTGNDLIRSVCLVLKKIIKKIDYFIDEDRNENLINFMELNDLFLTNRITNNLSYVSNINLSEISSNKKNLYELRKQVINSDSEDYLDDDFYYEDRKVK